MSLVRTNNPLSQVIIRQIGDCGGPRADSVNAELDNIIAWAKDSPRRITVDTSTVGNVGTGLDSLHSYSLAAGRLATNGDSLRIRYGGNFTNNADTKRVQISADGQVAFNSGLRAFDIGLATAWWIETDYVRLSATSLRVSGFAALGNALTSGGAFDGGNSRFYYQAFNPTALTVANLNSNAITLLVQGESSTATNDNVTQNYSEIWLVQQ